MKHRVYGRHLGRDTNSRSGLFRSLVQALFSHGTIETTETKGKAIKGLIDKIINIAKSKRISSSNKNSAYLLDDYISTGTLQNRLIEYIAPKLSDRTSGYTSVVRLGTRMGDQAMMVRMSLIGLEKMGSVKEEGKGVSIKGKEVKIKKTIKTKEEKQEDKGE